MPDPDSFQAGGVYMIPDHLMQLPGGEREVHSGRRPAVVVSDQQGVHGTNAQDPSLWPSLLVVPISSKTSMRTRFCIKVAAGEGNLKKRGWARVPALQMVDKEYLEDFLGLIEPETLDQITAQILNYLGILSDDADASQEEE